MTTISFDVMGNDNGVKSAVISAMKFIKKNSDFKIILVGDKDKIECFLKSNERIKVVNSPKTVDVDKGSLIIRDKDNSMYDAINLVKDKKADIVLSSGSSAAYIAYTTLIIKRIEGVERPAFMPIFPTIFPKKRFIMMDVGATLEVQGQLLHDWAKIGNQFSKHAIGVQEPRIAILNIGIEDKKGLDHHREAYKLLSENKELNFVGFVEPRDLLQFPADVIVTDGYAGNVCLKSMEGTGLAISNTLSTSMKKNPMRMFGYLISKGGFKNLRTTLDFRSVGGAWVMGIDGMAIKTHGSADVKSFMGSFNLIKEAVKNDAINKIRKAVK